MAPNTLPFSLTPYPKLTAHQIGHLRHFHNLANQPDGEWQHMGSQEPAQEFLDAYRYQLATMAYAAGLTHYHRAPALRSVFKPLMRQLIHKMLLRGCWGYWFSTSHSGKFVDPSLDKLREPWADPVVRENIMYSGHLLLMISLYAMLFDDDEFEKPGSIVFDWNPMFWGVRERFLYDAGTLQDAILKEMERNGWVGMIAMRYNDVRNGTAIVDEVLEKYQAAWKEKGLVMDGGLFPDWWQVKQDQIFPARDVGFTAWAGAFMNTWNHELVRSLYSRQSCGFITNIDGQVRLQPMLVANAYRRNAASSASPKTTASGTSSDAAILSEAIKDVKAQLADPNNPKAPWPYSTPTWGYVIKWLSELGKEEELDGLLQYADTRLNPVWKNGGLYYPRSDTRFDENLNWLHMDPFTGNAAIGYSRLNVKDGQRTMWEKPWTKETLSVQPWVDGLDLGIVAVSRGVWDDCKHALIVTVRGWDFETAADEVNVAPVARNLPVGRYAIYVDGNLCEEADVPAGGSVAAPLTLIKRGEEGDFVFLRV
ncbi:hypothetical protein N0V83_007582 [Neocucurbitaria cava]|uniref:Linalool dehydratase/isomerase domain-containing protein n=1 Tax=Neocucurbitaria cava TaxID=798079 RepID=A0A9W8Y4Y3_9PLEO|nr:hypothetical protein N0V83_007582 [Neocucurbitaria cava]